MNRILIALALCTLLAGCITPPSGSHITTHYYRLRYVPQHDVTDNVEPLNKSVLVKVDLPKLLDDDRMVYLRGSYEIGYKEGHRWAEDLDQQLAEVFEQGLRPYFASVRALPLRQGDKPDYRLLIDVNTAWVNEDGEVVLAADWECRDSQKNVMAVGNQRITLTGWKSGDFGNFAQKLSQAASTMAKNIGQKISGLDQSTN